MRHILPIITIASIALTLAACQSNKMPIPPGSYKTTCANIKVDSDNIYAGCQTINDKNLRSAQLNYKKCRGDIVNVNGYLHCVQPTWDYQNTVKGEAPYRLQVNSPEQQHAPQQTVAPQPMMQPVPMHMPMYQYQPAWQAYPMPAAAPPQRKS